MRTSILCVCDTFVVCFYFALGQIVVETAGASGLVEGVMYSEVYGIRVMLTCRSKPDHI